MNPTLGRRACGPTWRVTPLTGLAMVDCNILGRRQNSQSEVQLPLSLLAALFEKEDREALGRWREGEKQRRPLRKIDS